LFELLTALDDWSAEASDRAPVLFRISSLEPMDCTRDIVALVSSSSAFAPHFHLPLQHASDRVLAAMRRPYTIGHYAALVDEIRARIPAASIGADVIVGFPGEEDADFEALVGYLARSPLTHLHVFPYSDRPGTAATAMPGKVPGAVVRERARRVREIAGELGARFRRTQLGSVHRALTIDDGSAVVTGNYLKVRIAPGKARNEWVDVRIVSDEAGEIVASFRTPSPPAAAPPTASDLRR
jgi:threonylcarbamoyladenosine tRNA methylthiotransferase MtaB